MPTRAPSSPRRRVLAARQPCTSASSRAIRAPRTRRWSRCSPRTTPRSSSSSCGPRLTGRNRSFCRPSWSSVARARASRSARSQIGSSRRPGSAGLGEGARAPQATRSGLVKQAVIRSALIGFVGARLGRSRPLLALEQARLVSRLRAVSSGTAVSEEMPVMAGSAAAVLASGFALRTAARTAGAVLPAPLVNAGVAAAGTWALARAFRLLEPRLPSS